LKWSVQIGRIMGIPIKLHITFLIILFLFIYYFAAISFKVGGLLLGFNVLDASFNIKLLYSTIASILFFSTILIHELSHSYIARSNGINIQSITLYIFGGVAQMEEIPRNPKMELKMAAAGPGISLFIGIVTYVLYDFFGPVHMEGANFYFGELNANIMQMNPLNALLITLGIISFYNIFLGIFNLLPAFPMDGGRILRAFLAMWLPYLEATRTAVAIGKTFALLMGLIGVLPPVNPFLILIAFFVYYGAQGEERETYFAISLEGIKVRDVMTPAPNVIYIPPEWTISQLVEVMFRFKHMGYPVQEDPSGPPLGIITFHDIRKVQEGLYDKVLVKEVMSKDIIYVEPDINAYQALQIIARNQIGRLLVIQDNTLKGIITMKDIMRKMQFMNMYHYSE
jgi:Zn-dependent protease/predicted transcriptional regulator